MSYTYGQWNEASPCSTSRFKFNVCSSTIILRYQTPVTMVYYLNPIFIPCTPTSFHGLTPYHLGHVRIDINAIILPLNAYHVNILCPNFSRFLSNAHDIKKEKLGPRMGWKAIATAFSRCILTALSIYLKHSSIRHNPRSGPRLEALVDAVWMLLPFAPPFRSTGSERSSDDHLCDVTKKRLTSSVLQ